jgi:hypothetical protein
VEIVKTSEPTGELGPATVHGHALSVMFACAIFPAPETGVPLTLTSCRLTDRVPAPTYCGRRRAAWVTLAASMTNDVGTPGAPPLVGVTLTPPEHAAKTNAQKTAKRKLFIAEAPLRGPSDR